jgi:hypothetical protein
MTTQPTMEDQSAAFERYASAKRKADTTLLMEDAREAVEAWIGFINLFLPENERMPERRITGGNVQAFPVHRSRASTRL